MTLLSMAQGAWSQGKGDETFPSWNACESLTTLTDFVDDVRNVGERLDITSSR
jgi:hypothetical protein